jgi:RNA polymerase sigma factor (sigma-70 family)
MDDDVARGRSRLVEALDRDRRRLTRFVEARLSGWADAEDLLSDVVVRLLERGDLLGQVEDVTAYLYRALTNAIIDTFRKRRARPEVDAPDAWQSAVDERTADPETALAMAEQRDRLSSALARLPEPERAVWVAVEMHGRSFRELAQAWDEPIGTLLSRKSRAGKRLRVLLATNLIDPV